MVFENIYYRIMCRGQKKILEKVAQEYKNTETYKGNLFSCNSKFDKEEITQIGAIYQLILPAAFEKDFYNIMHGHPQLAILAFKQIMYSCEIDVVLSRHNCYGFDTKFAAYFDGKDPKYDWFGEENPDVNCDCSYTDQRTGDFVEQSYKFPWFQYWKGLTGQVSERKVVDKSAKKSAYGVVLNYIENYKPEVLLENCFNNLDEENYKGFLEGVFTESELKSIAKRIDKKALDYTLTIFNSIKQGFENFVRKYLHQSDINNIICRSDCAYLLLCNFTTSEINNKKNYTTTMLSSMGKILKSSDCISKVLELAVSNYEDREIKRYFMRAYSLYYLFDHGRLKSPKWSHELKSDDLDVEIANGHNEIIDYLDPDHKFSKEDVSKRYAVLYDSLYALRTTKDICKLRNVDEEFINELCKDIQKYFGY